MSVQPTTDPACQDCTSTPDIELIIEARARDLDGLTVRRVLPVRERRQLGPFVFFDHMGPATMGPDSGLGVRPHPHINLATVTYLFDGEIIHRDSLGSHQAIQPGAVNWMTAGRGIVHSERNTPEQRAKGMRLHGIQLWIALPQEHEETEPEFYHHPADSFPELNSGGATVRVLIGTAYGVTSPVKTFSPMFYIDAIMPKGSELTLPDGYHDRAAYIVEGALQCGPEHAPSPRMLVFTPGTTQPTLRATEDARLMLLGGAPLDGERHIWWNFVSSRKERIEQAKSDWKEGRFPKVPGDEVEFIPLPE